MPAAIVPPVHRITRNGTGQVGTGQMGTGQMGSDQTSTGQSSTGQIGTGQMDNGQMDTGQNAYCSLQPPPCASIATPLRGHAPHSTRTWSGGSDEPARARGR